MQGAIEIGRYLMLTYECKQCTIPSSVLLSTSTLSSIFDVILYVAEQNQLPDYFNNAILTPLVVWAVG